jgi:hypothetical protein
LFGFTSERRIAPQQIECTIPGDERQPRCRIFRNAFERPLLQSLQQRVLNHVFSQIEMS